MNRKLLRNSLFALLVLGYALYCQRYIAETSFFVEGKTYYVLFDDAMISMRYAYNLAHGFGAVWNAGERVEGFTNPLWVGIMALIHLFPVELNETGFYIQALGAALLILNLFFTRGIVEHFTDDLFAMLAAVGLTAFYAPLNSFGLLGMEVSLLVVVVSAAAWITLKSGRRFNPWIYILLAVSTLVRLDMAAPYLVFFTALFLTQKENRKKHLTWGLGLLFLFLGAQTLARFWYYGEWLPNTYYLKVEGWNNTLKILRGLYALVQFVYFSNWVLMFLPLTVFFFRRDWEASLPALVFLGQVAYSVSVGGDAWEHHGGANRYIVLAMPLFFAVFGWSATELLKKAFSISLKGMTFEAAWRAAFLVFFSFSILNFNALVGEWKSIERWNLSRRPDYVAGNDRNLQTAVALEAATLPGASIAVVGAGTIPYLLPDRRAIDLLGKTDPYIARQAVRAPMSVADIPNMRPGHMKWDYAHSIGTLKPDVIVSIWEGTAEEAAPYLQEYVLATIAPRIKVYLRKESPNIRWDKVKQ
ncbi:MAG: hypothetical protein LDL51_07065 [Chloroflexi bacterium]|nr:hypothetical protein [Chloroflexota bacterium]